ncbi:MAG TPA: ATP-binding protein [Longimicrobiales bacterium]
MATHHDDLDALARAMDLLLEDLEPQPLAERFLRHTAETFGADAALFQTARIAAGPPLLVSVGVEPDPARELAAELGVALASAREGCRRWVRSARVAARTGWRSILAAQTGRPAGPRGLLAMLSTRAAAFDPERHCRLLRIMARHAGAAVQRAGVHAQARGEAERLAAQSAQLDRARAALERRGRRLERALAARSRFLATASHELRTPLNAVLGYSQLLAQGVYGPLDEAQAAAVHKLASSCEQLLSIVNDLLDLSSVDAGRIELRPDHVDLAALIQDAIGAIEPEARNKGIELRVDLPPALPHLETDPARLRQILLNLLSNAVKFTAHGSVTVAVRHLAGPEQASGPLAPGCPPGRLGWVGIAVTDTGIGIPEEYLESIFDEFVRVARPGEAASPGAGLGLAISSRLARLLGGELGVDSVPGSRSTFELFLPCPAPAVEAAPAEA